jgi:hypothetical protein
VVSAGRNDAVVRNLDRLVAHFGDKARVIGCEMDNPLVTVDALNEALTESAASTVGGGVMCIDVSTFTHEWLLMSYRVLAERRLVARPVRFLYNRAADYAVGLPAREKWLSRGIREVRSVLGFPGLLVPTRPVHLVVLVGLEFERALALIDAYEPRCISIGCPAPQDAADAVALAEASASNVSRVRDAFGAAREFKFPVYDPAGTDKVLEEVTSGDRGQLNTIVAPMNTKLSTLGVAAFATRREDAQVCYAQPITYNYRMYSVPSPSLYVVDIPS